MSKTRILTREAYTRNVTDEMIANRQAEFVISSEAKDTYGTVFKMDGWLLERYSQNNLVCYQHRASSDDPDNIIGLGEVFVEGDKLIGRVTFEDAETNPKAEKIMRKVHNGTLKMASIGANIIDGRMGKSELNEDPDIIYFTRQELLEWSIVSVGSNPDALKRNADLLGEIKAENLEVEGVEVVEQEENRAKTLDVCEAQYIYNKNKSVK